MHHSSLCLHCHMAFIHVCVHVTFLQGEQSLNVRFPLIQYDLILT